MTRTARALLICAVFLCGLEKAELSQRGHCTKNQCLVLSRQNCDFVGAHKSCGDVGGQLFAISEEQSGTLMTLLGGFNASVWVKLRGTGGATDAAAPGLHKCLSVSVSMGGKLEAKWRPCAEELDGFLCQYAEADSCGGFPAERGAQVTYETPWSFKVKDMQMIPPGTIAAVGKLDSEYPGSKYVCCSHEWKSAPLNCEVKRGGCAQGCTSTPHTRSCPKGQTLQPDGLTCSKDPRTQCVSGCEEEEGDSKVRGCREGYEPARDGKSCVDVDECQQVNNCTGDTMECFNTPGSYVCQCQDGFVEENEGCVDISICEKCEHMQCVKRGGVYQCECMAGFKVSDEDPTRCVQHCQERDCLAKCIRNSDVKKDQLQCFCPAGYILDMRDEKAFCTDIDECDSENYCMHRCENSFGGFRCLCDDGYKLHNNFSCAPTHTEEPDPEEAGPGTFPAKPTAASISPAAVPTYIKTGSALGISAFIVLSAALLFFSVRYTVKHRGTLKLYSFKHPDIDIFYLHQVTTDTYKRLSIDKKLKNDVQRL